MHRHCPGRNKLSLNKEIMMNVDMNEILLTDVLVTEWKDQ